MPKILALALAFLIGCGTILNSGHVTIMPPPGALVDGVPGPVVASQRQPHEIGRASCRERVFVGV